MEYIQALFQAVFEREKESKRLRRFVKLAFSFVFFLALTLTLHSSVYATSYYVAGDTGNDTTGNGSSGTPWKTIQKAANTMIAGDIVNVKGGVTYSDQGSAGCNTSSATVVCITTSGSVGSPIIYTNWAGTGMPVINASGKANGINIGANYITISGFEIKNARDDAQSKTAGILVSGTGIGNNVVIKNNIIHNNTNLFFGVLALGSGINSSAQGPNYFYNNTIYSNDTGISQGNNTSLFIANNIVFNNTTGISLNGFTSQTTYNDVWNNSTNYNFTSPASNLSIDPQFIDYSSGNLRLLKASLLINSGTDLSGSGVTTDILGVARPQGSGYDIGAYEYYDIPVTLTTTPTTPSSNTTPTIAGTASTIGAATISSITYSVDSGSWSSSGVTGTSSFSIVVPALADGFHTVRVRATDSYGNVSDSTFYGSTTFTVDTTAPTSNSVAINSGVTYSTSTGVTLTLASTGASQMMVSEDSGFTGASWESYGTSKSFTLSSGDGTKTVYAKFKDDVDNTSSAVSDTITLDTANPTLGPFVSPRDYTKDATRPTLVFKKSTDTTSDISSYSVSLDSGKNKNYSISGIPATGDTSKSSYIWKDSTEVKVEFTNESDSDTANDEIKVYFKGLDSNELTEGKHSWKVTLTDKAGNENSATQDFDLDRTSPSISELAIANISTVKQDKVYTLSIFNRMPSFSGKVTDIYHGSEKTNDNGTKDTFDKVSSGPDKLTLTIKKLKDKNKNTYEDYLTQEYSLDSIIDTRDSDTSQRFYITTPFPLKDGNYQVTITLKDKAPNTYTYPIFYLKIGNSTIFSPISSFVSDLFNNKKLDGKQEIIPAISPSPTTTANILNSVKQQPISKAQSFFSWVANLFKSIFHK